MQTRSRAQQFGLAGFLYVSPDLFCRPVTRDPLGVALHNHTPIERPAQGLSFDARVDSISVQVLNVDPLARPAVWTRAKKQKKLSLLWDSNSAVGNRNVQILTI